MCPYPCVRTTDPANHPALVHLLLFPLHCTSSCDKSYLAEDTRVKCFDKHGGRFHYDLCCKTTVKDGTQRPKDFYCFVDKGSPEGNYAYCLGLADNPPRILGGRRRKQRKKEPPFLRSTRARREKNTDNIAVVLMVMGVICLFILTIWRKVMEDVRKRAARAIADEMDNVILAVIPKAKESTGFWESTPW